ncbi:hypothetical protein Bca101_091829 [Brassica carinata]
MATLNPFDLLGDDAEDPSQIAVSIAADKPKKPVPVSAVSAKSSAPSRQLPQPVREARNDAPRGGGRGGGDRGSSRGGYNRDFRGGDGNSGGYNKPSEEGGGGGVQSLSMRNVVYLVCMAVLLAVVDVVKLVKVNVLEGHTSVVVELAEGVTSKGKELVVEIGEHQEKKFLLETEEVAGTEIEKPAGDEVAADAKKENTAEVEEQKEPEDKYEKILEEKKKSLQSQTTSERKVDTKVFESMQQLSNKKSNDEIFIKLGSDKDKRKDDKEEKAKKAVSINEFLKPAEGENHYRGGGSGGGRGRGRGGRDRGGVSGGVFDGYRSEAAPAIGDTDQFPSLGGKCKFWNAMISGYGNLEMASGFFQTALVRGVCESVIITRYMKGNKVKLAEVFKDMTVKTNLVTWNASVMPEIFSARRWTETIQSNARGRHLVLTRLDWAVYCSDAASYQQYR